MGLESDLKIVLGLDSSQLEQGMSKAGTSIDKIGDQFDKLRNVVEKSRAAIQQVNEAWDVGYKIGEKVREGLQKHLKVNTDLSEEVADLMLRLTGYKETSEAVLNVENESVRTAQRLMAAREAHGKAIDASTEALKKAIPGWTDFDDAQNKAEQQAAALADMINKMAAGHKNWLPEINENKAKILELADALGKHGVALESLDPKVKEAVEWAKTLTQREQELAAAVDTGSGAIDKQAAALAAAQQQMEEFLQQFNKAGRTVEQQDAWDKNTEAINASVDALDAQNAALQEGFDAWETAGQAMGPFSVEVRKATEGYVATGNAAVDLIERLAQANDKMGDLALFAGSWIAELEKGNISAGEFRKKLDELSTGLPTYAAILRAAGVDVKDTTQSIIGMYQALNDVTFMESTVTFWERMGLAMGKAFSTPREEAEKMRKELEEVEIVAGRVNEAISGALGAGLTPEDVIKNMRRPQGGAQGSTRG